MSYCTLCRRAGTYVDEVTGNDFCIQHAGPLSALGAADGRGGGSDLSNPWRWSEHDIDLYSAALRICGEIDVACPLPQMRVA